MGQRTRVRFQNKGHNALSIVLTYFLTITYVVFLMDEDTNYENEILSLFEDKQYNIVHFDNDSIDMKGKNDNYRIFFI